MKKVRIVSLILVICMAVGWEIGRADLNEGLVAYYPFNGNANDESGYDHHGILQRDYTSSCDYCGNLDTYPDWNGENAPILTTDKDGNPDSAYDFGSNPENYINGMARDHITVLYDPILYPTDATTVSTWFTTRKEDPNVLVSCNETGGWRIVTLNKNTIRFTFDVQAWHYADESVRWWHRHLTYTDESLDFTQAWNKVTATYKSTPDGYVAKIYVNGNKVNEMSLTAKDAPAPLFIRYNYALAIGGDGCNWDQYAQIKFRAVRHNLDSTDSNLYLNENVFTDGKIDEVRIYNRVLDDLEIEEAYIKDTVVDTDEDGIPDEEDNCPVDYNPDQADIDADGIGDVCDPTDDTPCIDDDYDTICDDVDNCPADFNPDQADKNSDGIGNVCDPSYSIDDDMEILPDVINVSSRGKYITSHIDFPVGYSLEEVDVDSILLLNALPVLDYVINSQKIIAKFSRQDLIDLFVKMNLVYPADVEVTLTGNFFDGTPFTGEDTIKVVGRN